MKFAVPFSRKFKYTTSPQQIQWNIKYKPKIKELNDFIEAYQGYRINLIFEEEFDKEKDLRIIQALMQKFINTNKIVVRLEKYQKQLDLFLTQKHILHYYNEYVSDIDRFNGFLNLAITDILITNNLMFSISFLSEKAKAKNILLRTFCNVAQTPWESTPSLKTFFIRPEDMKIYNNYIDVFEFILPITQEGREDTSKLNIYYKIFAIDQKWRGPLKEIIMGYEGEEENQYIIRQFAEKRVKCQKKCSFKSGSCVLCDRIINLGELLKQTGLYINY